MNYEVVLGDVLTDYARPLLIESLLFPMVSSGLSLQDMCASPHCADEKAEAHRGHTVQGHIRGTGQRTLLPAC